MSESISVEVTDEMLIRLLKGGTLLIQLNFPQPTTEIETIEQNVATSAEPEVTEQSQPTEQYRPSEWTDDFSFSIVSQAIFDDREVDASHWNGLHASIVHHLLKTHPLNEILEHTSGIKEGTCPRIDYEKGYRYYPQWRISICQKSPSEVAKAVHDLAKAFGKSVFIQIEWRSHKGARPIGSRGFLELN